MSFQGIKKFRESRQQSPCLSPQKKHMAHLGKVIPIKLNLKQSKNFSKRTTRDSGESPSRGSKFLITPSKPSEKAPIFKNFMHINLDNFRQMKVTQNPSSSPSRTKKTSIEAPFNLTNSSSFAQMSIQSFSLHFIVGKGGFGKVWKVSDKKSGRNYAMKEMKKYKVVKKRSVHSVLNQKNLLTKLKHPFLVNMIGAFQDRENLYLVLDYCNRGDLRYHMGNLNRKFNEKQARFFICCILICLEYLHSKNIIHRDLKPENLVFDAEGYLRVTDLGVSRECKPNNYEDTSGTPGYMSPEVICKLDHSFPADFFAVGVMLYELMVGRRPYLGENRKQIRQNILAKQAKLDEIPPFGWSRDSVNLVNNLIQRKPENRLGVNGIQQVKSHPWFNSVNWQKLLKKQEISPFLPKKIEDDYSNYKECISEDTEIDDLEEYGLILRHKDTQDAFADYTHKIGPTRRRNSQLQAFSQSWKK